MRENVKKFNRLGGFLYNLDRAIASLIWGCDPQETISSEVGRISLGAGKPDGWTPRYKCEIVWARALAKWLNTTPSIWGYDHTQKAIAHADELDHADNGDEQ